MNNKQRYDFYKENGLTKQTEEDRVINLVNQLIGALYIPVEGYENVTKADPLRVKIFGIDDDEPINWGDLKCIGTRIDEDGNNIVIIDEAAPYDCPTFCKYIETFMKSYGWEIKAETEW